MLRLLFCLSGLALLLPLAGGCGQNEGGRCQISSDCASGLVCSDGTTGNGVCRAPGGTSVTDASIAKDAEEDLLPASGPETDPSEVEVEPDTAPAGSAEIDSGAIDSGALDS
jgi:hypothetical protein